MLALASRATPVCQPSARSPSGSIRTVKSTSASRPRRRTLTSPNSRATIVLGSWRLAPCSGMALPRGGVEQLGHAAGGQLEREGSGAAGQHEAQQRGHAVGVVGDDAAGVVLDAAGGGDDDLLGDDLGEDLPEVAHLAG